MKWEARIAAFRASGEKASHWCNANQVNRRQLCEVVAGLQPSLLREVVRALEVDLV
ncbi:hypothetical protein [Paenibacillus sp. sgz302251]|uniref:hypothetical protein n=1 Tax=Paenibacillus sp. sgz302251 TaxID=3414493 RepID=UPI003C7BC427